jgi:UPF0755 protein
MRRRTPFPRRALLVSAICVGAALLWLGLVHGTHRTGRSVEVTIRPGMSVAAIGRALDSADVVPHWLLFAAAARLSPGGGRMQSGTYRFPRDISVASVIDALAAGRYQVEIWVPVPEGATLRSIAAAVERRTGIAADSLLDLARDGRFLRSLGCDASSLEGYLRPDTYLIRRNDTPEKILSAMWRRRQQDLTPSRRARMAAMRRSLHDILTMASIVEGETRKASERARVAGVYYNRLRIGMLLQADPTIQYVIDDGPRRLYYSDLRIPSPYNTYRHRGLPPGPINNPGTAAIDAALYPETHAFLYFVADGTGGHAFSRTAAEHLRAVEAYRRQRDAGHTP